MTGVITEINIPRSNVSIAHEPVPDLMPAMTMPFDVKNTNQLTGLAPSNRVKFRLNVTPDTSWIDQIQRLDANARAPINGRPEVKASGQSEPAMMFAFTNEFGLPVRMTDFGGQAVALNFFFTRCPIPNACPRASQNFKEASERLLATPGLPTNWHFLSISIDSEFDSPAVLRAYAKRYNYNSNHWSFLTGPGDRIANLTRMFGFDFKPDSGVFSHGFRTVILTPSNKVQQIFPISGDLSSDIADEVVKALSVAPQIEGAKR